MGHFFNSETSAIIGAMYSLAKWFLQLRGWRIEGEFPPDPKFVAIGAPHTSNFDFIVFLGVLGHFNRRARYIGKHSLFVGPLGWLMRKLGGIPVNRRGAGGLVDQVVEAFAAADEMILVIAPEGTRSRSKAWKSGFHNIARAAGVPIVPASVNGADRIATVGPPVVPSEDVVADMNQFRDFFGGVVGSRAGKETPIVLAEEL